LALLLVQLPLNLLPLGLGFLLSRQQCFEPQFLGFFLGRSNYRLGLATGFS
jgi:hypothetical protein